MAPTTAQLRESARAAERQLQWRAAAELWAQAIAAYPGGAEGRVGLAARDIEQLRQRQLSAHRQANQE